MVLSDVDIRRYLAEGKIKITPELTAEQFGSCSIELRLGDEFSVFEHSKHALIDLRVKTAIQDLMRTIKVQPGEPFILQPRELRWRSLKKRWNWTTTFWEGSKAVRACGRIGIIVHGTAGLFDPGWRVRATLENKRSRSNACGALSRHADLLFQIRIALLAGGG